MTTLTALPRGLRPLLVSEARLMRRNPTLVVVVAALPVVASIVLGALPATTTPVTGLGGLSWFTAYQPILVMFSVVLLSVQVVPDVLTRYREMGVLTRLRATPATPAALLVAQMILTFVVIVGTTALMVLVPACLGATLPRNPVGFVVALVLSATAMLALGMVIASLVRSNKIATAMGSLLFFVLQFFAGLWVPRATMPDWLRTISDATPSGAAVGALTDTIDDAWPGLVHLGVCGVDRRARGGRCATLPVGVRMSGRTDTCATPWDDPAMRAPRRAAARPLNWERFDIAPVFLVVVPGALILVAALISLLTGVTASGGRIGALISLASGAMVLQGSWIRGTSMATPIRVVVFATQLGLTAGLIWVSPFFGIYAFTGYLTALMMFSGAALWSAMGANAVVTAAAQIGGFAEIPRAWPAYLALVAVNTALVVLFSWVGARRDREVAARESAVTALEEAHRRNAELQEQLLQRARDQGVLEERARLSREIHDTVAQDLVAIVSQLEAIDGGDDWARRVDTAKTRARAGLGEARRAVYALRSPMLDAAPLPTALTDLVDAWGTVHDIATRVHVDGDPVPTDGDQNLLRICQEALSNVSRHARAAHVEVRLSYVEEGVLLDITDDGTGFDPSSVHEGNGLRGMRERMSGSGGTVDVTTTPGSGCVVSAAVPA
ncbi:MAG: ABC transporter permease [Gordonia paraffinivorans]